MTVVSESLQTPTPNLRYPLSSQVKVYLKKHHGLFVGVTVVPPPPPPPKSKKYQHLKIKLFRFNLKCFLYKSQEGKGAFLCQLSTILFAFIFENVGGHSRLQYLCINGSVNCKTFPRTNSFTNFMPILQSLEI